MASEKDYAVIIGVGYDGNAFPTLHGTSTDAEVFKSWVVADNGGDIPLANVIDAGPNGNRFADDQAGIQDAFNELVEMTMHKKRLGRLFIFASGHGFADLSNSWDTGLVASNAKDYLWYHVALYRYADFFMRSGTFNTVVLFMDCCRSKDPQFPVTPPPLPLVNGIDQPAQKFYGHAVHWGALAKEGPYGGGHMGYFTRALKDAFDHAPADDNGMLTSTGLARFVHNRINAFQQQGIQVPPAQFDGDPGVDVVLGRARQIPLGTEFICAASLAGKKVSIRFDGQGTPIDEFIASPAPYKAALSVGFYSVEVDGEPTAKKIFQVPTNEPIHVG